MQALRSPSQIVNLGALEHGGGARNFGEGGKITNLCIIINIDKFSYFRNGSIGIIQ